MICITNLNVFNDKVVSIESLVLSIALGILQEMKKEFSRLQWPPSLSCTVNIGLSVATNTSHESSEGHDLLVGNHVLQILGCTVQGHGLDSLGCLPGVLEVHPQVGPLSFGRLRGIIRFNSVATHGF